MDSKTKIAVTFTVFCEVQMQKFKILENAKAYNVMVYTKIFNGCISEDGGGWGLRLPGGGVREGVIYNLKENRTNKLKTGSENVTLFNIQIKLLQIGTMQELGTIDKGIDDFTFLPYNPTTYSHTPQRLLQH